MTQQAVSAWMRGVACPEPERRAELERLTGVLASDWDVEALGAEAVESLGADDTGERAAVSPRSA